MQLYRSKAALAALGYAKRGFAVFPITSGQKAPPLTTRGLHDASVDRATVAAWWDRWPHANIGCATGAASGFWSLDIDGLEGEATLRELEVRHGGLPSSVEMLTGGGGRQIFFRYTVPLRSTCRHLGQGLDTRADGGYTVLPPSLHPSGRRYEWSADCAREFVKAPEWLLKLLQRPTERQKAKPPEDWQALVMSGAEQGGRNEALARLAGYLLRRHCDYWITLGLLRTWNAVSCRPPLDAAEVEKTVNSIAERELRRRGAA